MALDSTNESPASAGESHQAAAAQLPGQSLGQLRGQPRAGFLRRHRIALSLAVIALCIYGGSILWFVTNRGVG